MKKSAIKTSLLALTLLAALPFAASAAEGISYNYVEGGYVRTDTDAGDADGWSLGGSAAIAPNFHLFGNYQAQTTDDVEFGGVRYPGVDVNQWRVGVGYNHEISPSVDLLTRVAYDRYDIEGENVDGYSVEAGVRGALAPNFEGYALAGYEDGQDFDGDFYGRVGANVKFNPMWSLTGDVKFSDGDTQLFVGPRISF